VALAMSMRRMTSGSTKAVMRLSSSLCSSNNANTYFKRKTSVLLLGRKNYPRTNEMQAAASKILTRRSSNCSKMSFQSGLPSSVGSSMRRTKINQLYR
jgi:hypothetical protein